MAKCNTVVSENTSIKQGVVIICDNEATVPLGQIEGISPCNEDDLVCEDCYAEIVAKIAAIRGVKKEETTNETSRTN